MQRSMACEANGEEEEEEGGGGTTYCTVAGLEPVMKEEMQKSKEIEK